MKIVHLVSYDTGGAAIAAMRLNAALNELKMESNVIVLYKKKENLTTILFHSNYLMLFMWKVLRHLKREKWKKHLLKISNMYSYNGMGVKLNSNKLVKEADIIHIHWICNGYVTLSEISNLTLQNRKIVWTLHDMWAITGGCHYTGTCNNYLSECRNCIYTNNNESLTQQLQKKELFSGSNIILSGCSKWIADCAKKSSIITKNNVVNIANCINTEIFKAKTKEQISLFKQKHQINEMKKCILVGAMEVSDARKGGEVIERILNFLSPNDYELIVFGKCSHGIETRINSVYLGNIKSEEVLALIYSVADVFLAPSKEENLANTVMESISCGTPVVAFDIGGMKDMIEHHKNGYLAKPYDLKDFTEGIRECIHLKGGIQQDSIVEKFSYNKIANQYMQEYLKLMNEGKS